MPRIFISFEMEDKWARDLLVGQARNKRFLLEFTDYSLHEPFDEKWKINCTLRIALTRGTMVLVGSSTYRSAPVLWEIKESLRQGHHVFGVRVNSNRRDIVPEGLLLSRVAPWDIDQIVRQLDFCS